MWTPRNAKVDNSDHAVSQRVHLDRQYGIRAQKPYCVYIYIYMYVCMVFGPNSIWVVVKIMVPCWVLSIIRHLVFRGPKKDHYFDNHPKGSLNGPLGFAGQELDQPPLQPRAVVLRAGGLQRPQPRLMSRGKRGTGSLLAGCSVYKGTCTRTCT